MELITNSKLNEVAAIVDKKTGDIRFEAIDNVIKAGADTTTDSLVAAFKDGVDGKAVSRGTANDTSSTAESDVDTETKNGYNNLRVQDDGDVETVKLEYEEESALLAYKSGGSYLLNAILREDVELGENEQKIVNGLDKALDKLPVYQGKVYRNIQFDGVGDQAARSALISEHKIGELISYSAYTSTSTDIDGYTIDGEYVVHFEIESFSGRNTDGYGNNFESEVLFPRDTSFWVNNIEYDAEGMPTIYLTEVQNEKSSAIDKRENSRDNSGYNRGQSETSSESNSSKMQRLSEVFSETSKMRPLSEWSSETDSVEQGELQELSSEGNNGLKQNNRMGETESDGSVFSLFETENDPNVDNTDSDDILAFRNGVNGKEISGDVQDDTSSTAGAVPLPLEGKAGENYGEVGDNEGQQNSVSGIAESGDSAFSLPETSGDTAVSGIGGDFYNNLAAGLRGEKTVETNGEAEASVDRLSENVDEKIENSEKDLENGQNTEYNVNKSSADEDLEGLPRRKTRNSRLDGTKHPKTMIFFKKFKTVIDGVDYAVVMPEFEFVYGAEISVEQYKANNQSHNKTANQQLKTAVENDPELAAQFTESQLNDIKNDKTPTGYVWHHAAEPGKLQLVDSYVHEKTGHTGGRNFWG